MSKTHDWFATGDDLKLIGEWLKSAGAVVAATGLSPVNMVADGSEVVLHFPNVGPIELWPDDIELADYPVNSNRWRRALIAREQNKPMVDADRSAAAGLLLPEFRDDLFWISGSLWFPGANLKTSFPELNNICSRFERWIKRFPIIFDNRKTEVFSPYSRQLLIGGIIHKVVALPAAEQLLKDGAWMVDHNQSPFQYRGFKLKWEMR